MESREMSLPNTIDSEEATYHLDSAFSKKKLKELIRSQVEKLCSFADVKSEIKSKKLSSLTYYPDIEYAERHYVQFCFEFWINETEEAIQDIIDEQLLINLVSMFGEMSNIHNIDSVCEPWNDSEFYQIIKDHKNLISEADEKVNINNWKMKCLDSILLTTKSLKFEIDFIDAFLNIIVTMEPQHFRNLQLHNLSEKEIELQTLYNKLMYFKNHLNSEDLAKFKRTTQRINLNVKFRLKEMFFELISEFEKPPELLTEEIDGRMIIRVSAMNLVMSQIIAKVENLLKKKSNISEVRFIGGYIIHADASLHKKLWHGKNIVAFSRFIKTHGEVTWNVSGEDAKHEYEFPAGTDDEGNGKQGEDGYAGESGGNVLIQADRIDCTSQLCVISNGGKGSSGQDGGQGRDGNNGYGISEESFKDLFPPFCNFTTSSNKIETVFESTTSNTQRKFYKVFNNYFMEGKIPGGFNATFVARSGYRALVLCEGLPATAAGFGGEYGLGGLGGYAGNIEGITGETKMGEPGSNGEGGLYGKPGNHGWDMGYIDFFKFWGIGPDTQYIGISKNDKLTLQRYPFSGDNHVWCDYLNCYVTLDASKIINKNLEYTYERNTKRSNHERQNHAQPSRKKTISKEQVSQSYSKYVSIGFETLQSFKSDVSKIEELIELEINKLSKSEKKETTFKQRFKRHVAQNTTRKCKSVSLPEETEHFEVIINTETKKSYLFEAFNDINKELQFHSLQEFDLKIQLEPYLSKMIVKRQKQSNISNQALGNLNKFIYGKNTDVDLLINFINDGDQEYREKILSRALEKLLIKFDNISNDTILSKHYEDYSKFLVNKRKLLNEDLEQLVREFSQPINKKIRLLFLQCVSTGSGIDTFETEMEISKGNLQSSYNKINKILKLEYVCFRSEQVLTKLKQDIALQGMQSSSLREILSYAFDINIRYYVNKDNEYFLEDCHNSFARETVHFLYENNRLFEMTVDQNYKELYFDRQMKIKKYMHILYDLLTLPEENIPQYVEKKSYLKCEDLRERPVLNDGHSISQITYYLLQTCNNKRNVAIFEKKLRKLSSQFIDENPILNLLSKRFSVEGMKISDKELHYLINNIIHFALNDSNEHILIAWIIVTVEQEQWMKELLFLKLQNYFRKSLNEEIIRWRNALASTYVNKSLVLLFLITLDAYNESCITIDKIHKIFDYFQEIGEISLNQLQGLGLSEWPLKLNELLYSWIISQRNHFSANENASITHYALCISSKIGKNLTIDFLKNLLSKNLMHSQLMYILFWFKSVCEEANVTDDEIYSLRDRPPNLWIENLLEKYLKMDKDRNYSDLIKLFKSNIIAEKMNLEEIIKELSNEETKRQGVCDQIKNQLPFFVLKDCEILMAIDAIIEQKEKFKLRDVQKLSVMLLVRNENILTQILTGEGKSLIIVAFAIIKALRGEKVHVITSSAVLAIRDATINKYIFDQFGITVGHNCYENIEKRKESYSNCKVIYGELSHYQRDYLLDTFFGENILGDSSFDNVMIDEVDSMLVDRGNNMLYLSHEIAGFDKLESVYIFIWNWINTAVKSGEDFRSVFDESEIKQAVLREMYDIVDYNDLKTIDSTLNDSQIESLWCSLIDSKVLNSQGKIIKKLEDVNEFKVNLAEEFQKYSSRLWYLLRKCTDRKKEICLPNYLKPFVEFHLSKWIKSAITALFMKEFQNYVIDVDRTGSSTNRNPIVVILDMYTGVDQANSQWDEALHQFLQLKHGCKLTMQSLKSVFVSNVSYFKLYKRIYGVTGTLGSEHENSFLCDLHNIKTLIVPSSRPKRFTLLDAKLCKNIDAWIKEIREETKTVVEKEYRSILIICETMHEVKILKGQLTQIAAKVVTYTRDYEEFAEKEELSTRIVIIATNLAGRGTDIKLSNELRNNGGLHVCMTYLPGSGRVEDQGFGRAARRGEKGSGRLILISSADDITKLKVERNENELRRVSEIKSYYDREIRSEENYFNQFTETFKILKTNVENLSFGKILLDSCLDKWAMWLDNISRHINNIENEESKIYAEESLNKLLTGMNELADPNSDPLCKQWVDHNPMRMSALGKCFVDCHDYDKALLLFNEVIDREPEFCETSYYYKALCENRLKNNSMMKRSLLAASKLFNNHRNQLIIYSNIVDRVKNTLNVGLIQIQSYTEQTKCTYEIYSAYLQSIDHLLGIPITVDTFAEFDKEAVQIIYDDLIDFGILLKPKVNKEIDFNDLKAIAYEFKISSETLQRVLGECNDSVEEKHFVSKLKNGLNFCSKENFWSELKSCNIITDEIEYICIKTSDFKRYFEYLYDLASERNKKAELSQLLNTPKVIIFDAEGLRKCILDDNYLILEQNDLLTIIGKTNLMFLKNKNLSSSNFVGILHIEGCDSVFLNSFDSLVKEDLLKFNIPDDDANIILNQLIQENILAEDPNNFNVYRLVKNFTEFVIQSELVKTSLPICDLYEDSVMQVLSERFAYRIVLQEIKKNIENQKRCIIPDFIDQPDQFLYWTLVENRIIEPSLINNCDDKLIEKYIDHLKKHAIDKKYIKNILATYGISDPDLLDDVWNHLWELGWINEGIGGPRFVINYANILKNNMKRYLEYEQVIKDKLKQRRGLTMHTEMLSENLINLKRPDIEKCKLMLGDSVGIGQYLYASEEMQILRLSGLNEFLSLKSKIIFWNVLKFGYGVCKVLFSVLFYICNQMNGVRDGVGVSFFNDGWDKIKESLHVTRIKWSDYIKFRMRSLMLKGKKYATRFIYGEKQKTSSNARINVHRIMSHITKSIEFQPCIHTFLRKCNDDLLKRIMKIFDADIEFKLEQGNDSLHVYLKHIEEEAFHTKLIDNLTQKNENGKIMCLLKKMQKEVLTDIKQSVKRALKYDLYKAEIEKLHSSISFSHDHIVDLSIAFDELITDTAEDFAIPVTETQTNSCEDNKRLKNFLHDIFFMFLQEKLTRPIEVEGGRILSNILVKRDLEAYESTVYNGNLETDDVLRRQLYEERMKAEESAENVTVYFDDIMASQYIRDISKLLERIRKVSLFADLLKENPCISEVFLKVLVHVINKILNLHSLTIYIYNENMHKTYTTHENLQNNTVIHISLVNGKFQLYDNGSIEDFKTSLNHHNNLFDALAGKHEFIISKEKFAELVGQGVEQSSELHPIFEDIWKNIDQFSYKSKTKAFVDDAPAESYNYEIKDIEQNLKAIVAKKILSKEAFEIIDGLESNLNIANTDEPSTSTAMSSQGLFYD